MLQSGKLGKERSMFNFRHYNLLLHIKYNQYFSNILCGFPRKRIFTRCCDYLTIDSLTNDTLKNDRNMTVKQITVCKMTICQMTSSQMTSSQMTSWQITSSQMTSWQMTSWQMTSWQNIQGHAAGTSGHFTNKRVGLYLSWFPGIWTIFTMRIVIWQTVVAPNSHTQLCFIACWAW